MRASSPAPVSGNWHLCKYGTRDIIPEFQPVNQAGLPVQLCLQAVLHSCGRKIAPSEHPHAAACRRKQDRHDLIKANRDHSVDDHAHLQSFLSLFAPAHLGQAAPDLDLMGDACGVQLGSLLVALEGILVGARGQVGAEGHANERSHHHVELSHLKVPPAHQMVCQVAAGKVVTKVNASSSYIHKYQPSMDLKVALERAAEH